MAPQINLFYLLFYILLANFLYSGDFLFFILRIHIWNLYSEIADSVKILTWRVEGIFSCDDVFRFQIRGVARIVASSHQKLVLLALNQVAHLKGEPLHRLDRKPLVGGHVHLLHFVVSDLPRCNKFININVFSS